MAQVAQNQVVVKLPYRNTKAGAYTECRVYEDSGSRVEPTDVERSKSSSHGYDVYLLEKSKSYAVKCIDISNSGKKYVKIGEIVNGELKWNYVGPLYG